MTDPTTRFPLPDEPGDGPTAASGESVDAPPPSTTPADATSAGWGTSVQAPAPPAPAAAASATTAAPGPEPGWQPPTRDEGSRWPAVVFGIVLIVIGLWFFAEHTLGLDLPTIRWGQLWPLFIIGIGLLILYGARRSGRK
jgi:hypothetical protein